MCIQRGFWVSFDVFQWAMGKRCNTKVQQNSVWTCVYGSQWGIVWWSLHLNVAVFTLPSHLHCSEIAIPIAKLHLGVAWRRERTFELNVSLLNFLVLPIYSVGTDPFTHCWTQERVLTSLVLPFLHPSISSLCRFLFLLITSPLISDRTQENSFQGLICISPMLFVALLPLLPSPHDSPLPLVSYLCAGLCSAAFRPCQNRKHTPIPISPLSVEYTTWDAQLMIFALCLPFLPCPCEVSVYILPVITALCLYVGNNV